MLTIQPPFRTTLTRSLTERIMVARRGSLTWRYVDGPQKGDRFDQTTDGEFITQTTGLTSNTGVGSKSTTRLEDKDQVLLDGVRLAMR